MLGIAIGAAVVATPALGSHHASKRSLTMRIGDSLRIPAIDEFCVLYRHDPDGYLTGPSLFCTRESVISHSWGVQISNRWIVTINPRGYSVWQHARLP